MTDPRRTRCGSCCPPTCASSAGSTGEVVLGVDGPVTQRSVLDALEARHPVLRGTIREHGTLRRRAFVRFFACERDLSHEPPDAPLPDAVVTGRRAAAGGGSHGRGLSRGPRTASGPPFGAGDPVLSVSAPSMGGARDRSARAREGARDDRGRSAAAGARTAAGAASPRAHRVLLPDARLGVRGRGRRAGDDGPGVAQPRPVRGPLVAAVVALPDRDERLPRHAGRPQPPRPAHGDRGRGHRRGAAGRRAARVGLAAADAGRPGARPGDRSGRAHGGRASRSASRSWPRCSTCRRASGSC